jgi:hypothetical protein
MFTFVLLFPQHTSTPVMICGVFSNQAQLVSFSGALPINGGRQARTSLPNSRSRAAGDQSMTQKPQPYFTMCAALPIEHSGYDEINRATRYYGIPIGAGS